MDSMMLQKVMMSELELKSKMAWEIAIMRVERKVWLSVALMLKC